MPRGLLILPAALALAGWLALSSASAGGPPVVNETTHVVNQAFGPEAGFECATNSPALISGVVTGVVRTLELADGTLLVRSTLRGTASSDDLPADGTPDVTSQFGETLGDIAFPSGREVETVTLTGTSTVLATGRQVRVHFVAQLVRGVNGVAIVDFGRLTKCD